MPMSKKGLSGSAVFLGAASLYLVYIGIKDVPFTEGLRSLLRKEQPTPRVKSGTSDGSGDDVGTTGDLGLVGYAASALPEWRKLYPSMNMLGRGPRTDVANSDHPKGKAIDMMTSDPAIASAIITKFKNQTGAKYWIWNHHSGDVRTLWFPKPYNGPNPHTDHVHLSYF